MYVIASFEHSIHLELAITALQQKEIPEHHILAVPLDKRTEERRIFDTIHHADGYSLFDLAAILATCGMLLGGIYGMVLAWGPIIWGLIGIAAGALAGFFIKLFFVKKQEKALRKKVSTEVFVMVKCREEEKDMVEQIMWDNMALGVAKLNM